VIEAILSMGDSVRYFPTMSQWVGFRRGYLDVEHAARTAGKSTYTFSKLLGLAAHNMVAFSNKPLRLTVALGTVISSSSFLMALYYLVKYLRGEIVVLGYTSLILSIWFIGGMVIALVGMVGIYVGYTFERVKGRPTFIVQERLNWENDERTI
jgi:polyisoprenyl-phosphate glycosyltransferase